MIDTFSIKFNEVVWHDRPYHNPVDGKLVKKDFYDRQQIKAGAENILFSDSPTPIIIQGERRSGKTSLLRLLEFHLENEPSGRWVPLHIPYMGIHSYRSLFNEILQQLGTKVDLEVKDIHAAGDAPTQDEPAISALISKLRNVLDMIKDKTIVICIDEFDSILLDDATPLPERDKIIGFVTELAEQPDLRIKMLIAMTRLPGKFALTRHSPLTSKSFIFQLIPFTKIEMIEMIGDIIGDHCTLQPEDLERIYDLSGGWSYFAKLLLYYIVQQPGNTPDWNRVRELALKDFSVGQAIENIYHSHFNDDEKKAVLLLAKYRGHFKAENLVYLEQNEKEALEELCKRNFLKKAGDGSYGFAVEFLNEWFPQWIKFGGEVERRIKAVLSRLTCTDESWLSTPAIEITEDDLRKYGHE